MKNPVLSIVAVFGISIMTVSLTGAAGCGSDQNTTKTYSLESCEKLKASCGAGADTIAHGCVNIIDSSCRQDYCCSEAKKYYSCLAENNCKSSKCSNKDQKLSACQNDEK